ncbi:MAG TPA: hypothetical protein VNJ51_09935 [Candidatus Dormibacteraeota bacterium]|nr:hypothetical protein [Candidatus Dormibacteraeota bacterium]
MDAEAAGMAQVAAGLEASLLRPLFTPLERACGPLGDLVSQAWASRAAAGGGDAFAAQLRRALERSDG